MAKGSIRVRGAVVKAPNVGAGGPLAKVITTFTSGSSRSTRFSFGTSSTAHGLGLDDAKQVLRHQAIGRRKKRSNCIVRTCPYLGSIKA